SADVYKEFFKMARVAVRTMKEPTKSIMKDLQRNARRSENIQRDNNLDKGVYMRFLRQRAGLSVPPIK
uniref:mS112 n=1 Tax=Polytomella magna TaxID=353565 RepID=UPI002240E44B|nr:Chain Yg, mS112 [Polytomella magna]8APN_Yg Chain Yg, mS112 [Polytomella magna]8APO_Yg Chain Yg, mS112 [Polytomella magna]